MVANFLGHLEAAGLAQTPMNHYVFESYRDHQGGVGGKLGNVAAANESAAVPRQQPVFVAEVYKASALDVVIDVSLRRATDGLDPPSAVHRRRDRVLLAESLCAIGRSRRSSRTRSAAARSSSGSPSWPGRKTGPAEAAAGSDGEGWRATSAAADALHARRQRPRRRPGSWARPAAGGSLRGTATRRSRAS